MRCGRAACPPGTSLWVHIFMYYLVSHLFSHHLSAEQEKKRLGCKLIKMFIIFVLPFQWVGASLVAQRLKRLPPMQETQVQSLGQGDPLERETVTHSSILAWRIPWMEKPGRLQSTGSQRVGHDWVTSQAPPSVSKSGIVVRTWISYKLLFWGPTRLLRTTGQRLRDS